MRHKEYVHAYVCVYMYACLRACIRICVKKSYVLDVQSSILSKSYSCTFSQDKNSSEEVAVRNLDELVSSTGSGLDLRVQLDVDVCASLR